jgi:hypothetical protein
MLRRRVQCGYDAILKSVLVRTRPRMWPCDLSLADRDPAGDGVLQEHVKGGVSLALIAGTGVDEVLKGNLAVGILDEMSAAAFKRTGSSVRLGRSGRTTTRTE